MLHAAIRQAKTQRVVGAVKAKPGARHIIGKHEVTALARELGLRLLDEVLGLGGKAHQQTGKAHGACAAQNIRRALQLQAEAGVVFLDLLRGLGHRAVIGNSGGEDANLHARQHGLHGLQHFLGALHLVQLRPIRSAQADRAADEQDLVALIKGSLGQGIAHAAAAAVGEKSNRVQGLARGAGGDEQAHGCMLGLLGAAVNAAAMPCCFAFASAQRFLQDAASSLNLSFLPMIFLGIDSGTQSTKAIALDLESGELLASGHQTYGLLPNLPEGHLEQDPQTWTDAMDQSVQQCLSQLSAEQRQRVAGIGVSGQQHGLVALDAKGQSVRAAKLWCDTSTQEQCAQIAHEFGGHPGLIALAGNAMLPGYTIPKLLWLKQHEPQNFALTRHILLPHDYLNYRLSGVMRMEYGDASGMGILDVRERRWCQPICDFIDPRVMEMLPQLGSSRGPIGHLSDEWAQRWNLPKGKVILSAGGGDNMMGAIGTGNIKPGVLTASLGTSGTLYGVSATPVVDGQGEVAAFCDSTDQWLPLVCTMNVTVLTSQICSLFGWSLPQFEAQLGESRPGAGGLLFLPYLQGERTPNLPQGSGVLHGMRTSNLTPANLARAAVEGVTLGLAYGLKRLRELGMTPSEVRLTGGGSNSPRWRQIVADCFQASVVTLNTAEGAALGAAIQAAQAHEQVGQSYEQLCERLVQVDDSTRCAPQTEAAAVHAAQLQRMGELTGRLAQTGWL